VRRQEVQRPISEQEQKLDLLTNPEMRFRLLVEGTKDYAIFILDLHGHIVTWNSGAERIKGYRAEEILGQHISRFYPPEDVQQGKPQRELQLAAAEGRCEDEGWRVRKDGSRFWASALITALRDDAGNLLGFSKITRDLSERKRAEETIRMYADIVASVPIGLVMWHLENPENPRSLRLMAANPAASQFLGIRLEDDIGKTIVEVFPPAAARAEQLQRLADVIHKSRADDLGEFRYGDERVAERVWSLKAFPLPGNSVGVAFEDVSVRKRAEKKLRESEERFRAWTQTVKDAVISANDLGRIVFWNIGAQAIFGYTEEEALGQPLTLLMPDAYHEAHRAGLQRYLSTGVPHVVGKTVQLEGRRKGGQEFPLELSLAAWKTDKGTFFGGIIRDITERKRVEERFRLLLESAPDAMVIVRKDGTIALVNKQTEQLFGYQREELLNQPVELLVPEQLRTRHVGHRQNYFTHPSVRPMGVGLSLYGRRKDGTEFPVEISISPLATEEELLVSGAIRDITDRKRAEEKLTRFAKQVQRSNRELEQFASIASHDLQEPLRKIQTFGDRLQSKCGDQLGEQGSDYLRRMRSAAARMQAFISNLLAYSRLTSQSRPFAAVDLNQVAREVLSDLEGRLQESGGRVEVGRLPVLEADPLQMRQLLQNLIGNGLKFHRPEQAPLVRVEARIMEDDPGEPRCRITVQDNGIGFEDAYLTRIFEPFQRLHGPQEFEGTGMGLTICRRIVERHSGTITARGIPGQGATFIITLPVRQPTEERYHEP
jgi:two-component system, LuxR family, sensor kinase FixL